MQIFFKIISCKIIWQYCGHIRKRDGFLGMWRGVSPRLVNIAIQFFAEKKLNEVSWNIAVEINVYGTVMGSFKTTSSQQVQCPIIFFLTLELCSSNQSLFSCIHQRRLRRRTRRSWPWSKNRREWSERLWDSWPARWPVSSSLNLSTSWLSELSQSS